MPDILLHNNDAPMSIEAVLGHTLMHAAAINHLGCPKLLIPDQRLKVNVHNNNNKTPFM
jgi:hypothetical protein